MAGPPIKLYGGGTRHGSSKYNPSGRHLQENSWEQIPILALASLS
jgi:hypothetical protein